MMRSLPVVDEKVLRLRVSNIYRRRPFEKYQNQQVKDMAWAVEKTHLSQSEGCQDLTKKLDEIQKTQNALASDLNDVQTDLIHSA